MIKFIKMVDDRKCWQIVDSKTNTVIGEYVSYGLTKMVRHNGHHVASVDNMSEARQKLAEYLNRTRGMKL